MWISTSERQPSISDRYLIKASFIGGEPLTVSSVWRTDKWGIAAMSIEVHSWYEGLPIINVSEHVFKAVQQGLINHLFLPLDDDSTIGEYYYIRSSFDAIILQVTGTELIEGIANIVYVRIV